MASYAISVSLLALAAVLLTSAPSLVQAACTSSISVNIGVSEAAQCAYVFSVPESEDGTCPTMRDAMQSWLSMSPPQPEPTHQDLIAHYAFDENLSDSTANNRDGSATGQITYDNGKCGKAAVFNGQSKVYVNDFRNYPWGSSFSVSVWFRRTGSRSTYQGIVNTGYSTSGSWEIRMGREMSGQMLGGGVVTANSATTWDYVNLQASFGDWHHVVMTYDGSTLLFYLDNQLQSGTESCCQGDIISKDTPLTIGQAGAGMSREFFVGLIDEVKIFGKALTAEEVDTLFNSPCAS